MTSNDEFTVPGRFSKRWLVLVILTSLFLLAVVALFNFRTDPYRLFAHSFELDGAARPYAQTQVALSKARAVTLKPVKTLVLGNSRNEIGINPRSKRWPDALKPVYNASIPGSVPRTAKRLLQQAVSNSKRPELVLLGLDFLDFMSLRPATNLPNGTTVDHPEGFEQQLLVNKNGKPFSAWQRLVFDIQRLNLALTTLTATRHSIATIRGADDPNSATLLSDGFNPLNEYRSYFAAHGGEGLYRADLQKLATRFKRYQQVGYRRNNESGYLDELKEMLAITRTYGVSLRVYFYPYHSDILNMIDVSGLWEDFERFKIDVVDLVTAQGGSPVIDFSRSQSLTQAAPPAKGKLEKAPLYWEPSHFSYRIGNRMIDDLVKPTPSFGVKLVSDNLESSFAEQRQSLDEYQQQFPGRVETVKALLLN